MLKNIACSTNSQLNWRHRGTTNTIPHQGTCTATWLLLLKPSLYPSNPFIMPNSAVYKHELRGIVCTAGGTAANHFCTAQDGLSLRFKYSWQEHRDSAYCKRYSFIGGHLFTKRRINVGFLKCWTTARISDPVPRSLVPRLLQMGPFSCIGRSLCTRLVPRKGGRTLHGPIHKGSNLAAGRAAERARGARGSA